MKLYIVEAPVKDTATPYWARTWVPSKGDGEADKDELHDALAARTAKDGAKYG